MSLSADIETSVDLLGKIVTDLQDEVTVSDGKISGTLHYLDDYTGFSGDPAEQKGNYLAVVCTADEGDTIKAELIGGVHGPVTLDPDGILIVRITNKDTQKLKYTAIGTDGTTEEHVFDLSGLTLEEAQGDD